MRSSGSHSSHKMQPHRILLYFMWNGHLFYVKWAIQSFIYVLFKDAFSSVECEMPEQIGGKWITNWEVSVRKQPTAHLRGKIMATLEELFLDCSTLNMKALRSFETSGTFLTRNSVTISLNNLSYMAVPTQDVTNPVILPSFYCR